MTATTTIETLVARINSWNLDDVRELREIINDLTEALAAQGQGRDMESVGVDLSELPSVDLPEALEGHEDFPIWALDRRGMCLAGQDFEIRPVSEIVEHYARA